MSLESTHIIKKDDVAAARAVRPHPSVLQESLKIPGEHVEMIGDEEKPSVKRERRLSGENTIVTQERFEIRTREVVRAPKKEADRDESPENESETTIEEVEARWARRLEEEVAKAREEGIEAGKASVREETNRALEETRDQFARDMDAIQHAWENHLKDSQIHLVQLAFRIAQVVLDAPLPDDVRQISENALTDAVEQMVDGIPVEVTVHPVSYLRMQEAGLEEQLRAVHSRLRWRSDPTLKENEWSVQCDRSAIRRLEAELLDQLQRELSLRDLHSDDASSHAAEGSVKDEPADPDEPFDL